MSAQNLDGHLNISVENNFDPDYRSKRRSGIGLANVRERIEVRYGGSATFVAKPDGDRFRVEMSLPVERSAAA